MNKFVYEGVISGIEKIDEEKYKLNLRGFEVICSSCIIDEMKIKKGDDVKVIYEKNIKGEYEVCELVVKFKNMELIDKTFRKYFKESDEEKEVNKMLITRSKLVEQLKIKEEIECNCLNLLYKYLCEWKDWSYNKNLVKIGVRYMKIQDGSYIPVNEWLYLKKGDEDLYYLDNNKNKVALLCQVNDVDVMNNIIETIDKILEKA